LSLKRVSQYTAFKNVFAPEFCALFSPELLRRRRDNGVRKNSKTEQAKTTLK
jgi:hypothetical protein